MYFFAIESKTCKCIYSYLPLTVIQLLSKVDQNICWPYNGSTNKTIFTIHLIKCILLTIGSLIQVSWIFILSGNKREKRNICCNRWTSCLSDFYTCCIGHKIFSSLFMIAEYVPWVLNFFSKISTHQYKKMANSVGYLHFYMQARLKWKRSLSL